MTSTAAAHKPSDAQVRLTARGELITGSVDIAIRDLDGALLLDADGDGTITWGEIAAMTPAITGYVTERLTLAANGKPCRTTFGAGALVDLSDGPYWSMPIDATCPAQITAVTVDYRLLFDIDAQHHGLVTLDGTTMIVRDATPVDIKLGEQTSILGFVREGIWHIWIGFDHILFLLCLVLPAVFPRKGAAESFRGVAREVFEIVTAFTLAHSITLVISAVGLVTLPSRFVETAIALSVLAAAMNNLVRAIDARWAVAFALGLLHGFGFSSVLIDLGLPSSQLVGSLLGFNLGVEIGQAAIVIAVLPVLYFIRRTMAYQAVLYAGSAATALLAMSWS
ncbi:MAG: HupE/UreJ family protein, partial [Deltaproteobacteria bacterium]|nr:HupE/UreJ family protein [Deltaproteobacteria bacterium]